MTVVQCIRWFSIIIFNRNIWTRKWALNLELMHFEALFFFWSCHHHLSIKENMNYLMDWIRYLKDINVFQHIHHLSELCMIFVSVNCTIFLDKLITLDTEPILRNFFVECTSINSTAIMLRTIFCCDYRRDTLSSKT